MLIVGGRHHTQSGQQRLRQYAFGLVPVRMVVKIAIFVDHRWHIAKKRSSEFELRNHRGVNQDLRAGNAGDGG